MGYYEMPCVCQRCSRVVDLGKRNCIYCGADLFEVFS